MNIKTKHRNKIPAITNSIIPIFEIFACIFLFGLAGCNLRGDEQKNREKGKVFRFSRVFI